MNQQRSTWSRTAAPGEIIYSEGFAGESLIYVIADGKVEISAKCDDRKVVLATLGKGELFGEAALLASEPRANTAKALTFCQLTVIDASVIEDELECVSPLLRHIVRTTIRRVKKKDDLLATYTHADFLPGILSYAHVLALMVNTESTPFDRLGRARPTNEAYVPLREVIKKCRAIAGHSRLHVMAMLRRMEKLNLVSIDIGLSDGPESSTDRQLLSFDPLRITERAQNVADHDLDIAAVSELELIELTELEALIGFEKKLILNRLSRAEIAEDVFAFRKTKVLHYVEEKGVHYFARSEGRTAQDVRSLEDLELVDQRTLFEAVSTFDAYELAKLLTSLSGQSSADRLLSVMTEATKKEVSWAMRRDIRIDPIEVGEIEQRFLDRVMAIRLTPSDAKLTATPDAR